jgi:hypothetical protein
MDIATVRALTSQLAEDLGWLEEHCRPQDKPARAAGRLRLAAALVRNCIGPYLTDQPVTPLHIVVVGGAGAGKSTVANLLSGTTAAESNPQAGFTRHPIAYTSSSSPSAWTGHFGFLGTLRRLTEPAPSSLDQDVYQVRRVPSDPTSFDLLKDYVVWDCPDMTTWAAAGYVPRLIETAALADVLVYVASDERYNDEMPTQFLHMVLQSGKPAVVCLMKMREGDAPALVAHFQKEVVSKMPPGVVGCLAIPYLTPEQLADLPRLATRYRIPLINQVAVLGNPAAASRQRTVLGGMRFLSHTQEDLFAVARQDLLTLTNWQTLVRNGELEFEERYNREYLCSEKFRGFDEALIKLLELLELPGIGRAVSTVLYVVRTPVRLLAGLLGKAMNRPEALGRPEQPVLEEALTGWLDLLRKEAVRRSDTHPLWAHVAKGFHSGGLAEQARERFHQALRSFQLGVAAEVERTARAIYEQLERNPIALNSLRGSKLALEVASIGGTILTLGHSWVLDLALVPLVASLTQYLVELMGKQFVDAQREQTRQRQQQLLQEHLAGPLASWLIEWPVTGGSSFQRLQDAMRRIPAAIQQLEAMVRTRCAGA